MRTLILILAIVVVLFLALVPLVDLLVGVPPVVTPAAGAGQAEVSQTAAKVLAALVVLGLTPFRQSSRRHPSRRQSSQTHRSASRSSNGCDDSRTGRLRSASLCPPISSRDHLIRSPISVGRGGLVSMASLEAAGVEAVPTVITYCDPFFAIDSRTASATVLATARRPRVVVATVEITSEG